MAFSNSLSGLIAAAKALDVIGNNIANAQTIGFKSSMARFTNVAAAGKGSGPADSSSSAGVSADNVFQDFAQGRLDLTGNPLDMAINGLGFFRLRNLETGQVSFTRDGQFRLSYESDPANPGGAPIPRLVTRTGLSLTGNLPDSTTGTFSSVPEPTDIVIDPSFPAKATEKVNLARNLDSRTAAPLLAFDPRIPDSYSSSTGVTVFDDTGATHNLHAFFCATGAGNLWNVYTTMDFDPGSLAAPAPTVVGPIPVSFDTKGKLSTPMPLSPQTYTAGAGTLSIAIDLTGTTQLGIPFSLNAIDQDGYAKGDIPDGSQFMVRSDGRITARYTNGQIRNVAQLVLANFANPNALINMGENQWVANDDTAKGTGEISLGFPNFSTRKIANFQGDSDISEGMGSIQGHAREQSNVDLGVELVSLIEQQRNYQASAQTFKILDQVLQNLANMRSN